MAPLRTQLLLRRTQMKGPRSHLPMLKNQMAPLRTVWVLPKAGIFSTELQ
jgi:hypothetical protein